MQDNWHTLWSGDNGVSIQKSKVRLRGAMYRVDTRQERMDAWNWQEACSLVAPLLYAEETPPSNEEPPMPREDEPTERPTVYR